MHNESSLMLTQPSGENKEPPLWTVFDRLVNSHAISYSRLQNRLHPRTLVRILALLGPLRARYSRSSLASGIIAVRHITRQPGPYML